MNIKERLNKISDTLNLLQKPWLVLLTLIYLAGYLIWSYFSWKYNIGLISILNLQYILAGFPIIALLAIVILINRQIEKIYLVVDNYPKYNKTWRIILPFISWYIAGLAFYLVILLINSQFSDFRFIHLLFLLGFALVMPFTSSPIISHFSTTIGMLRGLTQIVFIVLFLFFVDKFYYQIPMEIGGLKPKNAMFYISDSNCLKYVQNKIPITGKDADSNLVTVKIVFYTNDSYFIETNDTINNRIIELSKSKIDFIIWDKRNKDLSEYLIDYRDNHRKYK